MNSDIDPASRPTWTIYALGGGMGHFTRGLSLARYAARDGIAVRILCNSPFLPALLADTTTRLITLESKIKFVHFSSDLRKDELIAAVSCEVEQCGPEDVFVVDTFPRGLGGELVSFLPRIRSFKVLVHRELNPDYVRHANLELALADYDFVVAPGENGPLSQFVQCQTPPWLICDSHELLPRSAARKRLGISETTVLPLVMVIGSGTNAESIDAAILARRLDVCLAGQMIVRYSSLDKNAVNASRKISDPVWPLLALHRGIDVVVGAGGYHTVHETRATATRLFAVPQRRLYDRQSRRLNKSELVEDFDDLVARTLEYACKFTPKSETISRTYFNGAAEAYQKIRDRWRTQLSLDERRSPAIL